MHEFETLAMCRRIERELAQRQAERRAAWAVPPSVSRARRWWWRPGRQSTVLITGTVSGLPVGARQEGRTTAAVGGTER